MPLSPPREPLRPTTLTDQLVATIRDAIVRGDLQPGEVLTEADLAATLGVSRTPVRQVLHRLAELDLVRIDVGRRYTVTPLDPVRLHEIVVVLAELFGLAARLAAEHVTDADLEGIERRSGGTLTFGEIPPRRSGPGFFDLLLARCGNSILVESVDRYRVHLTRVRTLVGADPGVESRRVGVIVAAMHRGDVSGLGAVARETFLEHGADLVGAVAAGVAQRFTD